MEVFTIYVGGNVFGVVNNNKKESSFFFIFRLWFVIISGECSLKNVLFNIDKVAQNKVLIYS